MPEITYYRFWCNNCKEFTLQRTTGDKSCKTCNTITETYKVSDIPIEKLKIQRERYKNSKLNFNPIALLLNSCKDDSLFKEEPTIRIIECDAGQIEIDELRLKKYKEQVERDNEIKREYEKYKHLNRNDICICGSGLKYKKCHFLIFKY
jgi:uncharacterized protein YecA (UPF0149 family)